MIKERFGFAAFDKESGKGLAVDFGITNRLSLTNDPERVQLAPTPEQAKTYTIWFNNTHKNKKEFEIKKVVNVVEIRTVEEGEY